MSLEIELRSFKIGAHQCSTDDQTPPSSNLHFKHLVTENGLGRLLLKSAKISPQSRSLDQTIAIDTDLSPRYYGDIPAACISQVNRREWMVGPEGLEPPTKRL